MSRALFSTKTRKRPPRFRRRASASRIAEQSGEIWNDRVQSLAKVFEVVGGIQVGFRRNSRGRIPLSLTRKYFSRISGNVSLTFYATINVNASRRISSKRNRRNRSLHSRLVPSIRARKCRVRTAAIARFQIIINASSLVIGDTFYNSMRVRTEGGEGGEDGTKRTYTLILSERRINGDDFNQPVITIKYINVRRINSTREGGKGGDSIVNAIIMWPTLRAFGFNSLHNLPG